MPRKSLPGGQGGATVSTPTKSAKKEAASTPSHSLNDNNADPQTPASTTTETTTVVTASATKSKPSTSTSTSSSSSSSSTDPIVKRVETQQIKASKDAGIDQLELPKTTIAKLAKVDIPDNIQLRKEVVTGLVKASTIFISYLTAASHELAIAKNHKTISAINVVDAVKELDLGDDFRKELRLELEAFRTIQKSKSKKSSVTPTTTTENGKKSKQTASSNTLTTSAVRNWVADESMDADVSRLTNNEEEDDDEEVEEEEEEEVVDDEEEEPMQEESNGLSKKLSEKQEEEEEEEETMEKGSFGFPDQETMVQSIVHADDDQVMEEEQV